MVRSVVQQEDDRFCRVNAGHKVFKKANKAVCILAIGIELDDLLREIIVSGKEVMQLLLTSGRDATLLPALHPTAAQEGMER